MTMTKAIEVVKKTDESPMNLASAVSDRVNIEDVRLVETKSKRGFVRDRLPGDLQFQVNTTTQVDKQHSAILVEARFGLSAKYQDSAPGEEPLLIEAVFHLSYKVESLAGLTKANFDAFGKLNGLYNAWPYWREYVQAMTTRMGFPSLTIPVLKPVPQAASPSSAAPLSAPKRSKGTAMQRLASQGKITS